MRATDLASAALPGRVFPDHLRTLGHRSDGVVAFTGTSTIVRLPDSPLGAAKGLFGYYHVCDRLPPGTRPEAYGHYWYKRFGADRHRQWQAAFEREYQLLDELRGHPSWITAGPADLDGEIPFYEMEYCPRGNLGEAVPVPADGDTALRVAVALAEGLGALHALGYVHRDVSAENILWRGGSAALSDLGCARRLDERETAKPRPDELHWPPEYRQHYHRAGPRADVFGLGGVVYRLLTGVMPRYGAPPCAELAAGRIPRALPDLVDSCLAYREDDRPASMDEVHAALRSI